jgi:sulfhydrogenase subunit beta (sulfur reductase)
MVPQTYFLRENDLKPFIEAIRAKYPVFAPVAKRTRFVFEEIRSADEVRLDYDTTILPPKKLFFPTLQNLLTFDKSGGKSAIAPRQQVLFGVHPHDVKAIDMADTFYASHHADHAYLANRRATMLVALTVEKPYNHAFFGSVCRELEPKGQDLWLTRIGGGYLLEVCSDRGR